MGTLSGGSTNGGLLASLRISLLAAAESEGREEEEDGGGMSVGEVE